MAPSQEPITIGMVGSGSMGGGMGLLFSEHGDRVGVYDVASASLDLAVKNAQKLDIPMLRCDTLKQLVEAFDTKKNGHRVFMFSLPHGETVDLVLSELLPLLEDGDVIIDGGNEWYEETERRQGLCLTKNVHFVGTGVSGGYQSARHGPSMSPSGTREAFEKVRPRLEKWAAKDRDGKPCVTYIGPGGSGHYVKMLHNGIEQGHLSILAEAHHLLHWTAGLSNDEIADIFDEWNGTKELESVKGEGQVGGQGKELADNFLIKLGADVMRFKKGDGLDLKEGIVDGIDDKVTQDIDNSEGTGVWSIRELAAQHIAAPTIAAAHQLRLISGPKGERLRSAKQMRVPKPARMGDDVDRKQFVEDVRLAVYGGILGAFVQGMRIVAAASEKFHWNLNYAEIIGIWRAGCIIQSGAIADILQSLYVKDPKCVNLLESPEVASELMKTYESLKRVCKVGIESDSVIPSIDATLGWIKAIGGEDLPTNFEETELDAFGDHMYDLKSERKPDAVKGAHHTEWKST